MHSTNHSQPAILQFQLYYTYRRSNLVRGVAHLLSLRIAPSAFRGLGQIFGTLLALGPPTLVARHVSPRPQMPVPWTASIRTEFFQPRISGVDPVPAVGAVIRVGVVIEVGRGGIRGLGILWKIDDLRSGKVCGRHGGCVGRSLRGCGSRRGCRRGNIRRSRGRHR